MVSTRFYPTAIASNGVYVPSLQGAFCFACVCACVCVCVCVCARAFAASALSLGGGKSQLPPYLSICGLHAGTACPGKGVGLLHLCHRLSQNINNRALRKLSHSSLPLPLCPSLSLSLSVPPSLSLSPSLPRSLYSVQISFVSMVRVH